LSTKLQQGCDDAMFIAIPGGLWMNEYEAR